MLELNNPETRYRPPTFVEKNNQQTRQATLSRLLMRETSPDFSVVAPQSYKGFESTSIGKMSLDDFVSRFEEYRNKLVEKKLRGARLSIYEDIELRLINLRLDELIGYEKPQDHLEALETAREVRRMLGRR